MKINSINSNAKQHVSGKLRLTMRGGMIESLNGELRIDLQKGILDIYCENLSSSDGLRAQVLSQFIKLEKGGFILRVISGDTNSP